MHKGNSSHCVSVAHNACGKTADVLTILLMMNAVSCITGSVRQSVCLGKCRPLPFLHPSESNRGYVYCVHLIYSYCKKTVFRSRSRNEGTGSGSSFNRNIGIPSDSVNCLNERCMISHSNRSNQNTRNRIRHGNTYKTLGIDK